jgi:hypothetical protein
VFLIFVPTAGWDTQNPALKGVGLKDGKPETDKGSSPEVNKVWIASVVPGGFPEYH